MFSLHARLAADSIRIKQLPLCELRLINDANYPWIILVPKRADIREIHELDAEDQHQLTREISLVSEALQVMTGAEKMNVAALGNMVPQLHIHVIARFEADAAWPGPIWGVIDALPYTRESLDKAIRAIGDALDSTP